LAGTFTITHTQLAQQNNMQYWCKKLWKRSHNWFEIPHYDRSAVKKAVVLY